MPMSLVQYTSDAARQAVIDAVLADVDDDEQDKGDGLLGSYFRDKARLLTELFNDE